MNAFGLMYREVTASNLVCVDLEGNIIDPGSTQLGVNRAGLVLHSAIHKARRDVKCAIHIHNTATVVVSIHTGQVSTNKERAFFHHGNNAILRGKYP